MIAVMQAFADGKEIEVRPVGTDDWVPALTPVWNWSCFEYRIKPEPKLRAYTFKELQEKMMEGKVAVKQKGEKRIFAIVQVFDDYIKLSEWKDLPYEELLETYHWLDGSPCGVIEEE